MQSHSFITQFEVLKHDGEQETAGILLSFVFVSYIYICLFSSF